MKIPALPVSEHEAPSRLPFSKYAIEETPSVADTEISFDQFSDTSSLDGDASVTRRLPLQWKFSGLTLWMELEEFNNDLSSAVQFASDYYGTEVIPQPHATLLYGMKISVEEARSRLHKIPSILPGGTWPDMQRPVAVKQDIAVEGRPGQVCSIAWAELTLSTNEEHEAALDDLYDLFQQEPRKGPWTPHLSIAYDNPEDSALDLGDIISYVAMHPSLLTKKRKVKAISLWDTNGKMADWKCIDRIHFRK